MKDTLNTVRVGLFFVLGLAFIWIVYETLQEGRLFTAEGYSIRAEFKTVDMLRSGDDVRAAGVRVGRVESIRLSNGRAKAILEIENSVQIPRDSVGTISMAGMLGNNFVSIDMGQDPETLAPNDELATRHTPGLDDIFDEMGSVAGRMDELFDDVGVLMSALTGTPDDPGTVHLINAILEENREALNTSLDNIQQVTDAIAHGDGTVSRLINDDEAYQTLMVAVNRLNEAAENASAFTGDAGEVMAHIRGGEGTLGRLIYREEIGQEIETLATNLRQVSDQLAQGEGTLGRLLMDDDLYREVEGLMQKAERTLDGLNEQGPITAVGVAAGALF